ncbi:hypothetical protein GGS20DRAFT_568399 [Poronia punctata]|nr:hypothetical protein GGS20DRAFT_568399 [Poronia punctata]
MALDTLYRCVYPLKPQERTRTKPMKVLCLGLPRTATDSLRVALTSLGYSYVYHGFDHIADANDCVNWVDLWKLKTSGQPIKRADFDRVIGHCEAVTDAPACMFYKELIEAYPEAKIIVNYREDVEAWHRSVVTSWSTAEKQAGWSHPLLCWFHSKMFWVNVNEHRLTYGGLWKHDYRKYAKDTYRDHYADLRDLTKNMPEDKVLEFKPQDGWGPLCEFLGKGIPEEEYPNRNALEAVVAQVLKSLMQDANEAWRNLALTVGLGVAGAGMVIWNS